MTTESQVVETRKLEVSSMDSDYSQLATDLMQAEARLALIARMARHNLEALPDAQEFGEVMLTILAACGARQEH
jgi:hypothetical protein